MLFECRRREFIRHPDFCERVVEAACERSPAVWVALQPISYLDGVWECGIIGTVILRRMP